MLSSGCDDCECRVLLYEGVLIGERAACPLGEIRMELLRIALATFHLLRMFHIRNSAAPTFHLDVSHPEFFSADIPSGYFAPGA